VLGTPFNHRPTITAFIAKHCLDLINVNGAEVHEQIPFTAATIAADSSKHFEQRKARAKYSPCRSDFEVESL